MRAAYRSRPENSLIGILQGDKSYLIITFLTWYINSHIYLLHSVERLASFDCRVFQSRTVMCLLHRPVAGFVTEFHGVFVAESFSPGLEQHGDFVYALDCLTSLFQTPLVGHDVSAGTRPRHCAELSGAVSVADDEAAVSYEGQPCCHYRGLGAAGTPACYGHYSDGFIGEPEVLMAQNPGPHYEL